MKSTGPIKLEVFAEPGSTLEKTVLQLLQDRENNRKRIKEDFIKRKEKIAKKFERRL